MFLDLNTQILFNSAGLIQKQIPAGIPIEVNIHDHFFYFTMEFHNFTIGFHWIYENNCSKSSVNQKT